ncbi:hypothetical protein ONA92_24315 [Mycobacteroides salmoniphilum]|uniref:hypothetical protein n=1 Tax=Mycobacteroides salmoniphilum TaxID=404941 RepID=UPI0035699AAE
MPEPTRALLEMVSELADRMESVSREIGVAYPEAVYRPWSPAGLRGYVQEWTEKIEAAEGVVEQLAQSIARSYSQSEDRAVFDFALELSRTIARHVVASFDVKPKEGKE